MTLTELLANNLDIGMGTAAVLLVAYHVRGALGTAARLSGLVRGAVYALVLLAVAQLLGWVDLAVHVGALEDSVRALWDWAVEAAREVPI